MNKKPSGIFLAVYVIGCVVTLGALWVFKNTIQLAIYDATEQSNGKETKHP